MFRLPLEKGGMEIADDLLQFQNYNFGQITQGINLNYGDRAGEKKLLGFCR